MRGVSSQGQVTVGGEDIYWAFQHFVACARLKDSGDVAKIKQAEAKQDSPLSPAHAGFSHYVLLHNGFTVLNSRTG